MDIKTLVEQSTNEVLKKIEYFLKSFASVYKKSGPLSVSFLGSLDEALNYSLFEQTNVNNLFLSIRKLYCIK